VGRGRTRAGMTEAPKKEFVSLWAKKLGATSRKGHATCERERRDKQPVPEDVSDGGGVAGRGGR